MVLILALAPQARKEEVPASAALRPPLCARKDEVLTADSWNLITRFVVLANKGGYGAFRLGSWQRGAVSGSLHWD